MNYLILVVRGKSIIAIENADEKPSEDQLAQLAKKHNADYCDVSRHEPLESL